MSEIIFCLFECLLLLGGDLRLGNRHLSELGGRHLSELGGRHLSELGGRHLSELRGCHLSELGARHPTSRNSELAPSDLSFFLFFLGGNLRLGGRHFGGRNSEVATSEVGTRKSVAPEAD